MTTVDKIAAVIAIAGVFFMVLSAVGVIKFPNFYTRLHVAGVGDTLGAMLLTIAMILFIGARLLSLKVVIVLIILLVTNPLGTNLIMLEAIHENNYHSYNSKRIKKEKE